MFLIPTYMITLKPSLIYGFNKKFLKPVLFSCVFLYILGVYLAFFVAPLDYQQLDSVRIMYIHVPSAWLALNIYFAMGMLSAGHLIWKNPLNMLFVSSLSKIGCIFSIITLVTGSLWGKPMWGTYWVWDARLTSMFILTLFYIGFIAYDESSKQMHGSFKNKAILAIIGAIDVPIVKFSVEMWNSLHQPSSFIRKEGIAIDKMMLIPLVIFFIASVLVVASVTFMRTEIELININKRNKLNNI